MVTFEVGELEDMRREFAAALPDLATVQRATAAADGAGGQTTTWATFATDVPCRLSPVGGGEVARDGSRGGDRISDSASAVVTFSWSQDITPADRIIIGAVTFDVQLVRRRGEWALSRRVECREV